MLKPAEQSPLTALALAELAAEAGVPDGVLNVVPGYGPDAGEPLGRHPDVDKIAFTGSVEIGRRFLVYAGESNGKAVSLELGGKSPQVVLADAADLDAAAERDRLGDLLQRRSDLSRRLARGRCARSGAIRSPNSSSSSRASSRPPTRRRRTPGSAR